MIRSLPGWTAALASVPVLALAPGLPMEPAPVAAQALSHGLSIQYSRGSYIFTEPTETFALHGSLGLEAGRLRLRVGLPVVVQDHRAVTFVGDMPLPTGGPDHEAVSRRERGRPVPMGPREGREGPGASSPTTPRVGRLAQETGVDTVEAPGDWQVHLADPLVSGAFEVFRGGGMVRAIELTAAVKPPLADLESGVGTGAWDAGTGVSVVLGRGTALLFGDLTYWWYGDMPELELRDGLGWGAGAGLRVHDRVSLLANLWGSVEVIDEVEAPMSLSAMAVLRISDPSSLGAGLSAGLTESTSDVSISISWRRTSTSSRSAVRAGS